MKTILENLMLKSSDLVIKIVISLVILLIGFKLIKILELYLRKEHRFSKLNTSAKGFVISFTTIALKVLLLIVVLTYLGIPMTSIITLVGSCALAIGLALQGGLTNIAGGLMIIIFKPFEVGDYIFAASSEGKVKSINIFYTVLTTVDNKEVMIPNGTLTGSNITNFTANKKRRVDMEFSVSYATDIKKVKKIIMDVVKKHELILKDEDVTIRLMNHGDSSLVFVTRVWTKTEDYWNVYFDLKEQVKEAFDKNKIEIPYPQIDVHNK